MKISLRKLQAEDAADLRNISIAIYRETFDAHNTEKDMQDYLQSAYNLEKLHRELQNPDSEFYFAETDKGVAGYLKVNVGAAQTEAKGDEALEIERIYVSSIYQGQGVAQLLMDKAVALAYDKEKSLIWLGVWEHNTRAQRFYEKYGFVKTGTHDFYMGDDRQTDDILERKLEKRK